MANDLDAPEGGHGGRQRIAGRREALLDQRLQPVGLAVETVHDGTRRGGLTLPFDGGRHHPVADDGRERQHDPARRRERVPGPHGPRRGEPGRRQRHADEERRHQRGRVPGREVHRSLEPRDQLIRLEHVPPDQGQRKSGQQPAEVGARVVVDRGSSFHPPDRPDDHVESEDDAEREHHEQQRKPVRQPPCRQLGDVEAGVVLEQRIGDAVGHTLPGERYLLPPLRAAGADQQAEQRPRADGQGEQHAGRQRLPEFQVGHVAAHLDRADGAIDDEEVTDEPRGGEEEAGEVEGETEDVPVGEEIDGRRRDLRGPPAVGEQPSGPAAHEQQGDDAGDRGDQPAAASVHATRERPARRASRRLRRGRRPAPLNRSPRSAARESPGCSRRGRVPSPWGR